MGFEYLTNPAEFLIRIIVGLYVFALLLRFLLQAVRADFYNPISQALVKITNPPLVPLRRIIPGFGGIDMAAVVLMLLILMLEIGLIALLKGLVPGAMTLIFGAIHEFIAMVLNLYFFTILIQVILSWVNSGGYNPAVALLYSINEPILGRARAILPDMSGLDLSPIVAIIAIKLMEYIVLPPLAAMAR